MGQFTEIQVRTHLDIVIWLPEGYPQKYKNHEEAHRRIAERIYQELAEIAARQVAAKYIGMRVRKFLLYDDFEQLAKEATTEACGEISTQWNQIVFGKALRVNKHFERLTDHGRNDLGEDDAIEQAFKLDAKRSPLLPRSDLNKGKPLILD